MRRRDVLALFGTAAMWPLQARAQPAIPVIGLLHSGRPEMSAVSLAGLRQGLREMGLIEGSNVLIEFRWAMDQHDRLPALARELVARRVRLIFAGGGAVTVRAAKGATTTIPIVFTSGGDPVRIGLVDSLSRPGANVTGVSHLQTALEGKRLELLRDLVPSASVLSVLLNPANPEAQTQIRDVTNAAQAIGREAEIIRASSEQEFEPAFAAVSRRRPNALLVGSDPFYMSRRQQIAALAARHAVPSIYEWREFVEAGGLMSYGTHLLEAYRQAGRYAGRILAGTPPGDLPIIQASKFELVISGKAAHAIGLTIPEGLLMRADEVIE